MPLKISSLKRLCPGRMIGGSNPCFIIAEIGQNHQGDIEIAKKMTKMAKDCGADCVKFQKSELEYKFNKRVAVDFLDELEVPFFKVASCDANSFPYLELTAKKGQGFNLTLLYTVINNKWDTIMKWNDIYWIFQTFLTNQKLKNWACKIKRHVTLDKSWKGNDHEASLDSSELTELVRQMLPCKKACHDKLGKSVVSKVVIPRGTVLSMDMLGVKVGEPGGISPASRHVWWMATTTRAESTRCATLSKN
uniref:N-acetylneuraminic acid synthase a n=1 Tax=Oncorhynchus mykiss TaxID=8022 RepID=A0A8C7QWI1_ONCMY